jgi:hypothetical protein
MTVIILKQKLGEMRIYRGVIVAAYLLDRPDGRGASGYSGHSIPSCTLYALKLLLQLLF